MDKYPPAVRSRIMSAVRSHGNRTTEKRMRAILAQAGIRGWRVQPSGVMGAPDFVFFEHRLAVFVDGAFWHGASDFARFPKSRVSFWREKIQRNRQRDQVVNRALRRSGWSVLRIWDYELERDRTAVLNKLKRRLKIRNTVQRTFLMLEYL